MNPKKFKKNACASIAILIAIFAFSITGIYPASNLEKTITELEKKIPSSSGKGRIDILNQLAAMTYTAAPKDCIGYAEEVLRLAGRSNYPKERARALIYMSYALSVMGDWEKPFKLSHEALALVEGQKDKAGIAKAFSALGYFYLRKDYFNIALDYFLKSLRINQELVDKDKDKINLYLPYANIGSLYINMEDYSKAREYYQKALDIVKHLKNDKRAPFCLHNIGLCYLNNNDNNKALDCFTRAHEMFKISGDSYWVGSELCHIGICYNNMNNPRQALTYLFQALELKQKIDDKLGMLYTLSNIGDSYVKLNDFPTAQSYYDRAFNIAKKLDDKNNLEAMYKCYSDFYALQNNFKKAYESYKQYAETRDFLFSQDKNKQIAELNVKFDVEKKAKEIEILRNNNKLQRITRNAFIIGFILVVIILILLFQKYLYLLAFWKKQKYIGQYRVIKLIGSGGMGTVFLAHTVRDKNQLAALKVLKEELVEDENSRLRFKHEGTIIDKLDHPNIIKIFERGEYKGKLFIAMEYLQGKTLAQKIIEEGKIDLGDGFSIMIQVTDALAFIHERNIVHRDLKPANIMIINENETSSRVKLLDFGVALMKSQTRLTQAGILVGTINYTAPEQISENLYSFASDVYSLGITFYEMISGKVAFNAETITSVVEKIMNEAPPPPIRFRPEIPALLNDLVMKMLSKEPGLRPSSMEVLSTLKKIQG